MRPNRFAFAALLLLTACDGGSAKEILGIERNAPDEFAVVSRPPLSVPKEFYLRPPSEFAEDDIGGDTDRQAHSLLTGGANLGGMTLEEASAGLADTAAPVVQSGELESPGEASFLTKVGTAGADKNIRSELSKDNAVRAENEPDFIDKLRGEDKADPVIDAKGESERIRANKDAGKPLDEGEVKEIKGEDKSVLDRLFE